MAQSWPNAMWNWWAFSPYFLVGIPPDPAMTAPHAWLGGGNSCSYSDPQTGALKCFFEGGEVRDANLDVMPNGSGLPNTRMSLLVPMGADQLMLFTVSAPGNELAHTLIDLSLNGGLGDVVNGQSNVAILGRVAAIGAFSGTDPDTTWLMVSTWNNGVVYAIPVAGGTIGTPQLGGSCTPPPPFGIGRGTMKNDWPNDKLAWIPNAADGHVELFHTDRSTGQLTDKITLAMPNGIQPLNDLEFSPSGELLYVMRESVNLAGEPKLWQLDLTQWDSTAIQNSLQVVASIAFQKSVSIDDRLSLGPDGRIYGSTWYPGDIGSDSIFVTVVEHPDLSGPQCSVSPDSEYIGSVGQLNFASFSQHDLWWPAIPLDNSVAEEDGPAVIGLAPNPAGQGTAVHVKAPWPWQQVQVFDATGRLLQVPVSRTAPEAASLTTEGLSAGLYLVRVRNVQGAWGTARLVVE